LHLRRPTSKGKEGGVGKGEREGKWRWEGVDIAWPDL